MYWQDILARVSAVHSRLQAAGPVLERRPLSICRGLLRFTAREEGRWQGTRSTARQRERRYNRKRDRDMPDRKTQGRVFRIQA